MKEASLHLKSLFSLCFKSVNNTSFSFCRVCPKDVFHLVRWHQFSNRFHSLLYRTRFCPLLFWKCSLASFISLVIISAKWLGWADLCQTFTRFEDFLSLRHIETMSCILIDMQQLLVARTHIVCECNGCTVFTIKSKTLCCHDAVLSSKQRYFICK